MFKGGGSIDMACQPGPLAFLDHFAHEPQTPRSPQNPIFLNAGFQVCTCKAAHLVPLSEDIEGLAQCTPIIENRGCLAISDVTSEHLGGKNGMAFVQSAKREVHSSNKREDGRAQTQSALIRKLELSPAPSFHTTILDLILLYKAQFTTQVAQPRPLTSCTIPGLPIPMNMGSSFE